MDIGKVTLPESNIPRQRAAEFKAIDDAGEPAIRAEVKAATKGGRGAKKWVAGALIQNRDLRATVAIIVRERES